MASHPKRRPVWGLIAARYEFDRDADKRDRFVRDRFRMTWATFDSTLSRGFSQRHEPVLRLLCADVPTPYEPEVWLSDDARSKAHVPTVDDIHWASAPITTQEQFYKELEQLYGTAASYSCLRVGGVFSQNRTAFDYDDDELATAPAPSPQSIRLPYLRLFWSRVAGGDLSGRSAHLVRNIDRLVELWAALDMIRAHVRSASNRIYLVPVGADDYSKAHPVMGVRVVDHDRCLFSVPAAINGKSAYSSWIHSHQMAAFAQQVIDRATGGSDDLTAMPPLGLRQTFEDAFDKIRSGKANPITNYGRLDTFAKVLEVKNRMLEWASQGVWLPVIA